MRSGFSDILVKPFKRKEIEDALNKWLSPRAAPGGAADRPAAVEETVAELEAVDAPAPGIAEDSEPEPLEPAIRVDELLDTFMGKKEIVLPLLGRFMERTESQIAGLPTLLERADWETLRREAHTLKGSALNLRAGELGNRAAAAEFAAKNQDAEASRAAIEALAPAYERFKRAATDLIDSEKE